MKFHLDTIYERQREASSEIECILVGLFELKLA